MDRCDLVSSTVIFQMVQRSHMPSTRHSPLGLPHSRGSMICSQLFATPDTHHA